MRGPSRFSERKLTQIALQTFIMLEWIVSASETLQPVFGGFRFEVAEAV